MIPKIEIGQRSVGEGAPCFIIAEAGSNHNRDLKTAFKLIDIAKEAGADSVKFQTFSAKTLYSKKTPTMSYLKEKKLTAPGETVWEMMHRAELPRGWHKELADYCREKEIIFFSTPFDLEAVDQLEAVGVELYKIASFEITHIPLLERVAVTGKPIILSSGMADIADIKTALEVIYKHGNRKVALLHCAINYPPDFKDLNLRAMATMREAFNLPVGFSDHTLGITSAIAAVALGACVIEKHFTSSRTQKGPDHQFALEPDELKAMVEGIRDTQASLGSPEKKHSPAEAEMYRLGRRSLVAGCDIAKGTMITREMLEVKRPGYGIHPKLIDTVVGRVAKKDIEEDDILIWDFL